MEFFIVGLGLGLAAGLAPGPLHVLVLTASMQRGLAAGLRIAIAPLLTDLPIVTVGVLAVGAMPDAGVRALALGGGLFITYLGVDALRWSVEDDQAATPATDLRRGFIANFLNPHPWLFWLGVGGPLLRSAWETSAVSAVAFLVAFYLLLIGTKVLLAAVASRGTSFIETGWYGWMIRTAAGALMTMGLWLVVGAIRDTL